MPRQRSFDDEVVLTAAMRCFWRRGYAATSMKDLEAATGLTTGSLYNGFGSKDELFRLALKHYIDSHVQARIARYLLDGDAREGLLGFVRDGLDRGSALINSGCFLVNTQVEAPLHGREVRTLIAEGQALMDRGILLTVERGLRTHAFATNQTPEALAQQISFAATALLARSRAETRKDWLEVPMRAFEAMLPPAS